MKLFSLPSSFALAIPIALSLAPASRALADETAPAAIRIVACDAPVQSAKRGLCLNQMSAKDFMALSPGVSWYYNWHYADTQNAPKEAHMEFLPMAWGQRQEDLDGLKAYLATHKPSHVLALNEPNLKGQAFITPEQSAAFYKKVKAMADVYKIPVVGPHMALGSGGDSSIKAFDPIEKKDVTYTFMVPYVKAFLSYMGDTEVSAVAAHSYGNFGELNWMTGMMGKEFNRPVWVTEFAQWGASSNDDERNYLIQAVDLFERTPNVQGYAWFKERGGDNNKLSLLGDSGVLTPLGETYVHMPVHDPQVFYRLPGRLQAESYLSMKNGAIEATKDSDGFLEMQMSGSDNALEYNVATARAGALPLSVRFKAATGTKVEILSGDTVLGSVSAVTDDWETAATSVKLAKGTQTLRVRTSGYAHLNWLQFGAK